MLNNLIYIAAIIFIHTAVWGSDCLLNEALKNPNLNSNPKFWEEFSKLSEKGTPSDRDLETLVNKYSGTATNLSTSNPGVAFGKALKISVHSNAEKEISSLPKNLRSKVDEFLEIATKPGGLKEIRENPGRWHLEKLKKDNSHTVRLNGGYRILFENDDEVLKILRVNREQIHGL
ncbi:MAG: type II toxin-antitoxin system RelE family toxin [Bdellovibrio sp.]